MAWTCPSCQRQFGRAKQGHECAPALSLDEYFSTGPERERPIYEAVVAHLDTLGAYHVEPVSVGILLKRGRTFAELRPMVRWEALYVGFRRAVNDHRIARRIKGSGASTWYVVNLRSAADVDDVVRDWLTEAYVDADQSTR
ncbi:MAG: DUF5655 domain-containing protein [Acidimicrobiales bacterium]